MFVLFILLSLCTFSASSRCNCYLAEKEIQSLLQVHNAMRSTISSGNFNAGGHAMPSSSTPIVNMTWDCGLEKKALSIAATCKIPKRTRGQNAHLFTNPSDEFSGSSQLIASAAKIWANQFNEFTRGWSSVNYTMPIALFNRISQATQMAWAETRRVGCSLAMCDSNHSALVVCKYKPAGNKINHNVYPTKRPDRMIVKH